MVREVRPAVLADIPDIVRLAQCMVEESPRYSRHGFSERKVKFLGEHLIPAGGIFVGLVDGRPVAFFAGFVSEHLVSLAKVATEVAVYVDPAHRGSSLFVRLVRAFEVWAIEHGADEILVGSSVGIDPQRTVCMYERMGYKMAAWGLLKAGA